MGVNVRFVKQTSKAMHLDMWGNCAFFPFLKGREKGWWQVTCGAAEAASDKETHASQGIPTHMADGTEVSKTLRRKLEKRWRVRVEKIAGKAAS